MLERRYITVAGPKWTCDYCRFWNRIDKHHGITMTPCPVAPEIMHHRSPVCLRFVNRFDIDIHPDQ